MSKFFKIRKLIKWTFYFCTIIALVALISMIANVCQRLDVYDCKQDEGFCLEFLSTYITSCKYQSGVAVFPWIIFYALVVCCCILHFILFQVTRGPNFHFYITFITMLEIVGILLIFAFDNRDLTGIQSNLPEIDFIGYIVDNSSLHNAGVFLLVVFNILKHLTWLIIRKFSNPNFNTLPKNNPKIEKLIKLEYFLDLLYVSVIVCFFVLFITDSIYQAIAFEYVLMVLYVLLIFCAVQIFNNQQKQSKYISSSGGYLLHEPKQ